LLAGSLEGTGIGELMAINISGRLNKITINSLDCSDYLEVIDLKSSLFALDSSPPGIEIVTGEITLIGNWFEAIDLDNLSNPTQWARGNLITIDCPDSTGAITRHPRGWLRILAANYSSKENRLSLEVGCELAFGLKKAPPDDQSNIELGVFRDRHEIINDLLAAAGVPPTADTISDWPINYPLPRQSGGYLEQAGKIARDAGYLLWCDRTGATRLRNLKALRTQPALLVRVVGVNEVEFERARGLESPRDDRPQTLTGSTFLDFGERGYQIEEVRIKRGSSKLVKTTEVFSPVNFSLTRTSFTEITEEYERPVPSVVANPENQQRILKRTTIESKIAEITLSGWLGANEEIKKLLNDFELKSLIPSRKVIEHFEYSDRPEGLPGEILRTSSEIYLPKGEIVRKTLERLDPDSDIFLVNNAGTNASGAFQIFKTLVLAETDNQVYRRSLVPETFTQQRVNQKAAGLLDSSLASNPDISELQLLALLPSEDSAVITSNSGQAQPPAPETFPAPKNRRSFEVRSELAIQPVAGTLGDRTRVFQIEYLGDPLVAQQQLDILVDLAALLITGRYHGCVWQCDLDDAWFSGFEPFCRIDFIDGNLQLCYAIEASAWTLSQTESLVGGSGILLGKAEAAPTAEIVGGEVIPVDPDITPVPPENRLPIPLFEPKIALNFGLGVGSGFNDGEPGAAQTDFDWFVISESAYFGVTTDQWFGMPPTSTVGAGIGFGVAFGDS